MHSSNQSLFKEKTLGLNTGCEPCLGDVGCIEVNETEDDVENLPAELLK